MKQFIVILTILAFMLAVTIVYQTPDIATGENIIEYSYEEPIEEVIEEAEEDNEVDFDSDYDYYCWLIGYAAERNGIEPKLAIAISRLETGNFVSEAFINFHNFGGLTGKYGLYEYQKETDGLEAYIKCLKWYQDSGMDTAEKMARVYCPDNAESWLAQVNQIMREL